MLSLDFIVIVCLHFSTQNINLLDHVGRNDSCKLNAQLSSSNQMDMQLIYGLTGIVVGVGDYSETIIKFLLLGQLVGYKQKMSQDRLIRLLNSAQIRYSLFGYYQVVHRSNWIQVLDCKASVVLIDKCRR